MAVVSHSIISGAFHAPHLRKRSFAIFSKGVALFMSFSGLLAFAVLLMSTAIAMFSALKGLLLGLLLIPGLSHISPQLISPEAQQTS